MPIDEVWSFKPPGVPTLAGKLSRTIPGGTWPPEMTQLAARAAFAADYVVFSHGGYSLDCVLGPNGKRVATLTRKVDP
jgi:hypothetical protein